MVCVCVCGCFVFLVNQIRFFFSTLQTWSQIFALYQSIIETNISLFFWFYFSTGPLQCALHSWIFCVKSNELRFVFVLLFFLSLCVCMCGCVFDPWLLIVSIVFDLNGSLFEKFGFARQINGHEWISKQASKRALKQDTCITTTYSCQFWMLKNGRMSFAKEKIMRSTPMTTMTTTTTEEKKNTQTQERTIFFGLNNLSKVSVKRQLGQLNVDKAQWWTIKIC